ncbi:uncharacterized protein LY79DRAFT_287510 [Colletotrichum navitas]|uniref:Uncharacterized protein n=1 Tax=Colletotrichum navitas TaxID=681940 RepID=A0AAD8QA31_9PEZI|nr:uncharacterized protein LY79DRAFT_287510 [Colletotrichum navitas]KAK1598389.1 hypothetical protein LY79DRAFT_287510 [Colletotrichum navitas]
MPSGFVFPSLEKKKKNFFFLHVTGAPACELFRRMHEPKWLHAPSFLSIVYTPPPLSNTLPSSTPTAVISCGCGSRVPWDLDASTGDGRPGREGFLYSRVSPAADPPHLPVPITNCKFSKASNRGLDPEFLPPRETVFTVCCSAYRWFRGSPIYVKRILSCRGVPSLS